MKSILNKYSIIALILILFLFLSLRISEQTYKYELEGHQGSVTLEVTSIEIMKVHFFRVHSMTSSSFNYSVSSWHLSRQAKNTAAMHYLKVERIPPEDEAYEYWIHAYLTYDFENLFLSEVKIDRSSLYLSSTDIAGTRVD